MARAGRRGLFITLEGIEGAGKSTQARYLRGLFRRRGRSVILTREPGGTALGEQIRKLLLFRGRGRALAGHTELLLMFAARQQHLEEVIRPALRAGRVVICDRFTDSTYAYQGGGHGIPRDEIKALEQWVQRGLKPDLTLLFDLPIRLGLARAGKRRAGADWFESQAQPFFRRVRRRYLDLAAAEPRRVRLLRADRPAAEIRAELEQLLRRRRWI